MTVLTGFIALLSMRYEIIQYLIYLNEIFLLVKLSEKVVAPYGKLSPWSSALIVCGPFIWLCLLGN